MVLGLAAGALGGGGGISPSSSSSASGGSSASGQNVINVGGAPQNLGAIVQAVQGGGSSLVGGNNIGQRSGLPNVEQKSGFNFSLPGFDAGITINPLLIAAAGLGVFILPRLIKRR